MAAPPLRIPLGLNMQSFDKAIGEAKSKTAEVTKFLTQEFAKTQLRLVVNQEGFRPAVQGATKFLTDEFAKVKPQVQQLTQSMVKETTETALKAGSVLARPAITGVFQGFTAVGVPAAQGLASALLPIALRLTAIAAAGYAVAGAIGAAQEQIKAMVDLSDRASKLNVTPQFLQLFEGEARKLKVTTAELEAALTQSFNATKDKSPIYVGKYEVAKERITDIELALRVYNATLARAAGTKLEGLVLFRDADTQEQKVRAVLQAMVELEKIGQRAAAIDLAEKMFGTKFADNIRLGKITVSEMLSDMDKLKASQDGLFPDSLVLRAKAVDDQLKLQQDRLDRALKPSWDGLAGVILTIKQTWAEVVGLIAQAVELANKFGRGMSAAALDVKRQRIGELDKAIENGTQVGGQPLSPQLRDTTLARYAKDRDKFQGEIDAMERDLRGTAEGPDAPKRPSRGTGGDPNLRGGTSQITVQADAVDRLVNSMTRQNDIAQVELDTMGKSATERERGIALARAEAAARAANRKLLPEERDQVLALADAHAQLQARIEAARPLANFIRDAEDVNRALSNASVSGLRSFEDGIVGVVNRTKTLKEAFSDMARSIADDLLRITIRSAITGPLARGILGMFTGGGAELPGFGTSSFVGPQLANGGVIPAGGLALVSEHSPGGGRFVRAGNEPITITPNDIAPRGGGGSNVSFGDTIINGSGLNEQQLARAISASQIQTLRAVPGIAVKAVASHQQRYG